MKTLSSLIWKFILSTVITLCMARHVVGVQVTHAGLTCVGMRTYATTFLGALSLPK